LKLRVDKTPAALADLREIGAYIGEDNLRAELRFYDAAEDACDQLAEAPGLGVAYMPEHPVLADIRRWQIPRFTNYLIFYRVMEDAVEIIRVLHGARDNERILGSDD
jgi:toxin ParE1/3/4